MITYNMGGIDGWFKGERYLSRWNAIAPAQGTILYVWKDDKLIRIQNIRDQIIQYIRDRGSVGTHYMYLGVEIGLEAMPDHCLSSFISHGWDVIPLCRRIARHCLRSL